MQQTSYQSDLNNARLRSQGDVDSRFVSLEASIAELQRITADALQYSASPNYLPNSHPEFSKLAFTTAGTTPATAGDDNRECYNWWRQTVATVALVTTDAETLKRSYSGAQHTDWAANEGADDDIPIWDGVNGNFCLGGETVNWDIACPLPTDVVFPGQQFYVYFEAQMAAGASIASGTQFYCGFWDNSAKNRKWIEGGDFTPTLSVQGAPGSRTLEYKILAETDSGEEILSAAVSTSTAPATLTTDNHVRLFFSGAPGFIRFRVYRKDGSNYYKVADIRNSIDLQFFDMVESGDTVVSEPGYPTVSGNRPKAYAITNSFSPGTSGFTVHTLNIKVPLTYDRSQTENAMQWFRFGVNSLVDSSADVRGIKIRRLSVSEGYGAWVRSNLDLSAASGPTSTATDAPGSGTPTIDPPTGGGGGISCVTLDTLVPTADGVKPIADVESGDIVDNGLMTSRVISTIEGIVQQINIIETANGCSIKCSNSHRFIRSSEDTVGIAAKHIKEGDLLLTCVEGRYERSEVIKTVVLDKQTVVKSVKLPKPHLFICNGFVNHNLKDPADV